VTYSMAIPVATNNSNGREGKSCRSNLLPEREGRTARSGVNGNPGSGVMEGREKKEPSSASFEERQKKGGNGEGKRGKTHLELFGHRGKKCTMDGTPALLYTGRVKPRRRKASSTNPPGTGKTTSKHLRVRQMSIPGWEIEKKRKGIPAKRGRRRKASNLN